MHNIDDITLMFDGSTGKVIFLIPNAIVFDNIEEFTLFLKRLKEEIENYASPDDDNSNIEVDYAERVIGEWQQVLEKSEISGQKRQSPEH